MFTLFVDNLPQGYSSLELRKLFSNHGYIADAYVPQFQRNRENGRFGFIVVLAWEQGERLIHEVDGMVVGSLKVNVNRAKYPKRFGKSKGLEQFGRENEKSRKWKNWKKGSDPMNMRADRLWRNKQQPVRATLIGEFGQVKKSAVVVTVEEVQENLEWLDRSLTCISDSPRDIESLSLMITNAFQEKVLVRDLGKFKFLLTLETKEIKERMKTEGHERLQQWFSSISDWAKDDVCQSRRIWLEIVGLPIQLWSEKNIRKIAQNWGDVVMVEEESSKLKSFASAKVIIDTLSVNPIEDEAIIQTKDKGYRVSIFEAKTEFTIFHTGPLDVVSSGTPISKDKGKIDGLDSAGIMGDQVNVDHGYWMKDHSNGNVHGGSDDGQTQAGQLIVMHSDGGLKDQGNEMEDLSNGDVQGGRDVDQQRADCCELNSNLNLNSNFTHHVGQPRGNHNAVPKVLDRVVGNQDVCDDNINSGRLEGALMKSPGNNLDPEADEVNGLMGRKRTSNDETSYSSSTRTRTAQLSGNDYSVELEKINHPRHDQSRVKQGADLEDEVSQRVLCLVQPESEDSIPPGFGMDEGPVPSGLADITAPIISTEGKGKASRRQMGLVVGHRVTRSQMKKTGTQTRRCQSTTTKTNPEKDHVVDNPLGRQSIETTESMKQLAEEALAIGEILGVKVINHKANAVKRITDSLKSNRAKRSMGARR